MLTKLLPFEYTWSNGSLHLCLPSPDCLGLHLHIDFCCICAFQLHCNCSSFQVFNHSLLIVTIVFCWGEFAWHSLTYVQLLTSLSVEILCVTAFGANLSCIGPMTSGSMLLLFLFKGSCNSTSQHLYLYKLTMCPPLSTS